jgi:hypothetical protein
MARDAVSAFGLGFESGLGRDARGLDGRWFWLALAIFGLLDGPSLNNTCATNSNARAG